MLPSNACPAQQTLCLCSSGKGFRMPAQLLERERHAEVPLCSWAEPYSQRAVL